MIDGLGLMDAARYTPAMKTRPHYLLADRNDIEVDMCLMSEENTVHITAHDKEAI